MNGDTANLAPNIPRLGQSSLITWAGYHSSLDCTDVDRRAVGAIAKPLVYATADARVVVEALDQGLGVVLDGETWRNQLPLGHQKRTARFGQLPFAQAGVLNPKQRWGQGFIEKYATDVLDMQLTRGATIATSAAHHFLAEGGNGRENDLALARAAVLEFRARRGHHPAREGLPPRAIFASIIIEGTLLKDAGEKVISQYAPLDVDGFWISVANSRSTAEEVRATALLAFGLERETNKPVVVSCVGRPHSAFLAYGLAGVCAGHLHGSFSFPPYVWPEPDPDDADAEPGGIGTFVYHERIRGATKLDDEGNELLAKLFSRWPCQCGAHPPSVLPRTKREKLAHNQFVLEKESAEICVLSVSERPALLREWIEHAVAARKEFHMSRLNPGWRAIGEWFDDLDEESQQLTGS